MTGSRSERLAPLTGVAFFVAGVASFAVGGEPKDADHPAREIVAFYGDNKDSVQAAAFIAMAAALLLVFFAAHLRGFLKQAAGERETLSLVAFAGLLTVAIGFAIDATIQVVLAESADNIDPVAVQALQALWDNDFVPIALGVLCFLWATGLSALRSGALPKWVAWLMLALGVCALTPLGFVSAIGSALLVLGLGIYLTIKAGAGAAPVPARHEETREPAPVH